MDDPHSELRVLHKLTQNKMAGDTASDIVIRFVDENDYSEISAKAVSAKRKFKKSRPSWLVSKRCNDVDASEAESSSEEDVQENVESSYSDHDSSAGEAKRRKSAGKPKPGPASLTVTKSSKKAPKKSNKRNKSLSEEEMERFSFPR